MQEELNSRTYKLRMSSDRLVEWVRHETGHQWFEHPAANRVLKAAFDARLARQRAGKGEPVFKPGELPETRLVAAGSDNPREMGLVLETLEFRDSLPQGYAKRLLTLLGTSRKEC